MRKVIDNAMYECKNCKAIVAGHYLDWFANSDEKMFMCPICSAESEFVMVEGEAPLIKRRVVISDDGDVLYDFIVTEEDARSIADNYSTDWMDEGELQEYLRGK